MHNIVGMNVSNVGMNVHPVLSKQHTHSWSCSCEKYGFLYLQEAACARSCLARPGGSYNCEGATERELAVFGSQRVQVFSERWTTGSIARRVGSGRPSKVTAEIKQINEEQMRRDDETAYQLHCLLSEKGYLRQLTSYTACYLRRGTAIFLRTILRCRTTLGWTFRGSAYCQLKRDANKAKRLQWAWEHKDDSFDNVIWSDECTV